MVYLSINVRLIATYIELVVTTILTPLSILPRLVDLDTCQVKYCISVCFLMAEKAKEKGPVPKQQLLKA